MSLNISTLSYFGIQQDDVLRWDIDIQGRFQEGIKSSRTLDIMITGMPGSGKTALINGFLGRKFGEEENTLGREATRVEAKKFSFNSTVARIWDTPGLQDGTDEYLEEMKKYCSNCNLYIYCMSMLKRFDEKEVAAIRKLTDTFGKDWWKKVLFVLTFANLVERYCPMGCDKREFFERRVKECHDALAGMLVDSGVEQEIAEKIVVVPTGYRMPLKTKPDPWCLPGISNWVQNFWYKCAEVIDDRGFSAFVHIVINSHRLNAPEDVKKHLIQKQQSKVQDHITAAGIARAGIPASSRKSSWDGAVMASSLADVAAGDVLGNVNIDPTAISLYWKYSNHFPFATGEP